VKLISLHVENFGCLQNLDISFDEGLNTVVQDNGWGKSTLMSFIRVMLYGFENESKRSAAERERNRYMPWQGGVYGGNICFESKGKKYILTRIFGTKADKDVLEIRDADTNLSVNNIADTPGISLFGIDRDSFSRTVFIGQDEIASGATGDINAKLGNLTDDTADINNYDLADEKMKDALNSLNPGRATGSINKLSSEISNIRTELLSETVLVDSIDQLEAMLKKDKSQLNEFSTKRDQLNKEMQELSSKQKTEPVREKFEPVFNPMPMIGVTLMVISILAEFVIIYLKLNLIYLPIILFVIGASVLLIGIKKNAENRDMKQAEDARYSKLVDKYKKAIALLAEMSSNYDEYNKKIDILSRSIRATEQQIYQKNEMLQEIESKKAYLDELREDLAEQEHKYKLISDTKAILKDAKERLTARYINPLKIQFDRYYSIVNPDDADRFIIDAESKISYVDKGVPRINDTLSRGQRDITWICLRFAFIDVMYQEEKPPVFIDDAFVNLDGKRYEATQRLLDEFKKDHQIIYFTRS